jgi:hypothetical protein
VTGKYFLFITVKLNKETFPEIHARTKKPVSERYGIRIYGMFGERESRLGTVYFTDWETFYNWNRYIYLGK